MSTLNNTSNHLLDIAETSLNTDDMPEPLETVRQFKPMRHSTNAAQSAPYSGPNLITLQMYAKCPVLKIT